MPEDFESQDRTVSAPGEGVGGWLLVLCIVWVVATPLVAAHNLLSHFQQASSDFAYTRGLERYLFVVSGMRLLLVILSMHAGISLWTERPRAVRTAKVYLWSFIACLIVGVTLAFLMVEWPQDKLESLVREIAIEVGESVVFFLTCYGYLLRSKRVKATYLQ